MILYDNGNDIEHESEVSESGNEQNGEEDGGSSYTIPYSESQNEIINQID